MVDLPNQTGPMCAWPTIELVPGARSVLRQLNRLAPCHLATNAADSSELQIKQALERAALLPYITQIFCRANLACSKSEARYFNAICQKLAVNAAQITMIGDSLERDIDPASALGLNAIWYNPQGLAAPNGVRHFQHWSDFFTVADIS